jgi:hypothetical protein
VKVFTFYLDLTLSLIQRQEIILNTSLVAFSLDANREILAVFIICCSRKPSHLPRGSVGMIVLI